MHGIYIVFPHLWCICPLEPYQRDMYMKDPHSRSFPRSSACAGRSCTESMQWGHSRHGGYTHDEENMIINMYILPTPCFIDILYMLKSWIYRNFLMKFGCRLYMYIFFWIISLPLPPLCPHGLSIEDLKVPQHQGKRMKKEGYRLKTKGQTCQNQKCPIFGWSCRIFLGYSESDMENRQHG